MDRETGNRCCKCLLAVLKVFPAILLVMSFCFGLGISFVDYFVMIKEFTELVPVGQQNVIAGTIHFIVDHACALLFFCMLSKVVVEVKNG